MAANSIESMIDERERRSQFEKLNMIIGLFFSEVGTNLLKIMSSSDPAAAEIRSALVVSNNWIDADFSKARTLIEKHTYTIDSCAVPMDELYQFLKEKKGFLLMILDDVVAMLNAAFTSACATKPQYGPRNASVSSARSARSGCTAWTYTPGSRR
ncbi:hypothetical protein [Methanoregula formicica]|uniref:hypothetical protein n=1 Tax=Methanoregula formicica TaxID=882104 RepID=UPI0006948F1D|nr:hypothetical protein [Methanoregula formicica]